MTYSGGHFTTNGIPVQYPSDGSSIDFIAYYPYKEVSPALTLPIDISNQNPLGEIDLLYSDNAAGLDNSSPSTANLTFRHQLSRLVLNIESADGSGLQDVSVSISGVKRSATFSLVDATLNIDNMSEGVIDANTIIDNGKAKVEAILLPVDITTGITVQIVADNKTYILNLSEDANIVSMLKGRAYSYNIKLNGT